MSIDNATVTKIASLARIRVAEDEKAKYANQINGIMTWIEQLNAVPTDGIEPLASVNNIPLPLRADVVTDGDKQADILANAPETTSGFFAVPKIVE
ncbi:MAG: Asp-tRNA(Asn)/Glu-tRNA(Gln) amidotransferase subunit GatC [Rhodospirillales bacterium]|nr:Asp-tRNA(Asn)/Glu-tRNA(Gln) amidotransferase subunit GatC [Alphaproteobacteria bacterium]MCB9987503.1 Asp-tRNA(Asn)/Glu-tRNA(Gln) amidotransferase subunit GatC [Rhodospirillales bacterium]USO07523.1 MAG: Asp-tRNA(Asn)/Glu-tRNA(Gln) amidotransferase subunit GatC [Rhodospirillales bacterium]